MRTVNLVEAKAHLSELVAAASGGSPVAITRRGKLVARITAPGKQRRAIRLDELKALSALSTGPVADTEAMISALRDDVRY